MQCHALPHLAVQVLIHHRKVLYDNAECLMSDNDVLRLPHFQAVSDVARHTTIDWQILHQNKNKQKQEQETKQKKKTKNKETRSW